MDHTLRTADLNQYPGMVPRIMETVSVEWMPQINEKEYGPSLPLVFLYSPVFSYSRIPVEIASLNHYHANYKIAMLPGTLH